MRLKAVCIENFRGYLQPTTIDLNDFTSIIGRNDVGKSTMLDALEIFFNGGKPDSEDAHIDGRRQPTRITCHFDSLPESVVIDARAPTSLSDEYLLNSNGNLEIVKEFDLSKAARTPKVFANAFHPSVPGGSDLLQLKITQLRTRATEHNIDLAGIDERVNSNIRRVIWAGLGDLQRQETLIPLNSEDAKKVWDLLQEEMPTFALFRADRQSRDDDSEVTNPFDIAIRDAVQGLAGELDEIKTEVQRKVEAVARRTLDKLREMDQTLADDLRVTFKAEPRWAGFKLTLNDHRNIPINKRGSGVRRLILLNFFRAEAERQQQESKSPGIIYAIEEPESSQHPYNQRLLIDALLELSATGHTQIIITTHVPGIAALVPQESICCIQHDENRHPRVHAGNEGVFRIIADELGILPDKRVQVLLYVEGPNDVAFLERVSRLIGPIDLAAETRVAFVLSGGGNLKHWVNSQYLRDLGLPEVHIYDRDNDGRYQEFVDNVNDRNNGDWATLTTKREIENYIHKDAIRDVLGIDVEFTENDDVPMIVAQEIHEASDSPIDWDAVDANKKDRKASTAKRRLCRDVVENMTTEQLIEQDPNGEIQDWFSRISQMLN